MLHLLFRLTLLIALVCVLTILGACELGAALPLNASIREFADSCEGQTQPCWYGIIPGKTKVEAAKRLLVEHGYVVTLLTSAQLTMSKSDGSCPQSLMLSAETIRQINITFCQPMLLGDFVEQNGLPDTVVLNPLSIWYQGEIKIMFVPQIALWETVSYHTPLQEIILFPADSPMPYQRTAWLDVLTQRKYCQLKGLRYHCGN